MSKIHIAAKQGDIETVARELAAGAHIDTMDEFEKLTPLMCSIASPLAGVEMVRYLVERGANVEACGGFSNENVLCMALRRGNIETVEAILDAGAAIDYEHEGGYGALIDVMAGRDIARDANLVALVNLLIARGASTAGESDYGESALSLTSNRGRFDVVAILLAAGADARLLEWTPLMYAIALGTLQDVEQALQAHADLTERDRWSRTPWLLAIKTGEVEKAKLLLSSGANRDDRGHCEKTPLRYAIENEHIPMLKWLLDEGFDVEAADQFGDTALLVAVEDSAAECLKLLIAAGAKVDTANNIPYKAMEMAGTVEIVRMLVAAGEDLNGINDEMRALLTGVESEGDLEIAETDYLAGREPRFGNGNPELMNIEFWNAMVRCGRSAWHARSVCNDVEDASEGPVWCFHRFGKSITELPDGRFVEIGGEHEDSYDADFCIYNDVVVHHGGGKFQIFGYPRGVFPPTDFHSSTLVGDCIYIIGCLGYPDERDYDDTPVFRLHLQSYRIEKVATTGRKPHWISRHRAILHGTSEIHLSGGHVWTRLDGELDYVDNAVDYILDLDNMTWH